MKMMTTLFFSLLTLSIPATAEPLNQRCQGGNYTAKSPFQSNLHALLTSLSSSNATSFTDAKGSAPDRTYGLGFCRGDLGPVDCSSCLNNAAQEVLTVCPFSKKTTVWYDDCELRYADFSFFSIASKESNPHILISGYSMTMNIDSFVKLEMKLLDLVAHHAAYNSTLKFATGIASNGSGSSSQIKIYALAQCTGDLSMEDCNGCLQQIRGTYIGNEMRIGGRVLGQSCNFRYETYPFFQRQPTVSLDLSAPPPAPLPPPGRTPSPPHEGPYSPPLSSTATRTCNTWKHHHHSHSSIFTIIILSVAGMLHRWRP